MIMCFSSLQIEGQKVLVEGLLSGIQGIKKGLRASGC